MNLEKETARYLGYRGSEPEDRVKELIAECLSAVKQSSDFRIVCDRFDVWTSVNSVHIGELVFESKTLSYHLKDCHQAVVLCATLGVEIDRLLHKLGISDIAKCAVLQAASSAYLEYKLDEYCNGVAQQERARGNLTHTRYSPGYGDLALECQREVLDILSAGKKIGVGTTDAFALTPTKTVTAIVGIYKEKREDKI